MPSSPARRRSSTLLNDHARWMAVAIELLAVGAAVAFAYQHSAS